MGGKWNVWLSMIPFNSNHSTKTKTTEDADSVHVLNHDHSQRSWLVPNQWIKLSVLHNSSISWLYVPDQAVHHHHHHTHTHNNLLHNLVVPNTAKYDRLSNLQLLNTQLAPYCKQSECANTCASPSPAGMSPGAPDVPIGAGTKTSSTKSTTTTVPRAQRFRHLQVACLEMNGQTH